MKRISVIFMAAIVTMILCSCENKATGQVEIMREETNVAEESEMTDIEENDTENSVVI